MNALHTTPGHVYDGHIPTDTEENDMSHDIGTVDVSIDEPKKAQGSRQPRPSYAEITLKSGAVVHFECTSLTFTRKRNALGEIIEQKLQWELPEGAEKRPVFIDLNEIAVAVFVDGTVQS